jgi:glycine/D-amino acid oxidase-like deaminating enzyme
MPGIDIAVVGGGILARAIAHRLAGNDQQVAWIRPTDGLFGEASAAAGAMLGVYSEVSPHDTPDRRLVDLEGRRDARARYSAWLASIEAAGGGRVEVQDGLFVVGNALGEDDEAALDAIADVAAACGQPAEELRGKDVPGYAPQAAARGSRALFLGAEGSVDASALLRALDTALLALGVPTHAATVTNVNVSPSDVRVTLDDGREICAGTVVLATGTGTTFLLRRSGLDTAGLPPVFSGRGVSLTLRSPHRAERTIRTPNRTFACGLHLVPQGEGGLYVGATNRLSMLPDSGARPTVSEVAQLLTGATRELNTRLADAEILGTRVGHRPVTADRLPCVGRTAVDRLLVATGTYRNGVLLAPLCAELIAMEIDRPGSTSKHPFQPVRATPAPPNGEFDGWLRRASRSLVTTIVEPGGHLPHHGAEDLEGFFYAVLRSSLDPKADRDGLLQKLERTFRRAPIEEGVPLLFEVIARHRT